MKHFDAIIIGAGQAGVPLAKKLAEEGKKTALIEKNLIGGTCINVGCTPTKAMIASARAAHHARNASKLGVEVKGVKVDLKKIKKRKDKIVQSFRSAAQKGIEATKNLTLIFGEAKFSSKKEISIKLDSGEEEQLKADWIFIDTGAKPNIPDIKGLEHIDYLTSSTILDLEAVPEHLVIIGGNYIGLEFGQMFRRFGSKVTILERSSRIMKKEDKDIALELSKILKEEGLEILTETETDEISNHNKQIVLHIKSGDKSKKLTCSHLLIATGRNPQTQLLNLELAGIKTDKKGNVLVNKRLETNVPGVYALGDVKGGPAFTHISYNDYTLVYRNLMKGTDYSTVNRPIPYCMFTDPQLGRIGMSEAEAEAKGLNYKVAKIPMSHVARGIETGETSGLMKAIVDLDSKKILGASILASEGGEIMSVLEMAMEGNITYDRLKFCVFAHPTYSESLNNLFMEIEDQ
ncbi:mercuric reductase [Albibacterium sp.]|uniref:mercuric reductase n=1 Tax=Albibacterium sp. TaxID=2952885 RepID=UPI002C70F4BC|nr:mercuric reductase [Albibacterium sp.]HUH19819.1 mercuric reductase [Albibacterium sp.]